MYLLCFDFVQLIQDAFFLVLAGCVQSQRCTHSHPSKIAGIILRQARLDTLRAHAIRLITLIQLEDSRIKIFFLNLY